MCLAMCRVKLLAPYLLYLVREKVLIISSRGKGALLLLLQRERIWRVAHLGPLQAACSRCGGGAGRGRRHERRRQSRATAKQMGTCSRVSRFKDYWDTGKDANWQDDDWRAVGRTGGARCATASGLKENGKKTGNSAMANLPQSQSQSQSQPLPPPSSSSPLPTLSSTHLTRTNSLRSSSNNNEETPFSCTPIG